MQGFEFPQVHPVIRDGQSVVELRQNGEVVGEVNFTKIVANWFDGLGIIKKRPSHLKVVP